ncbi:MAG TPA: preprotein translocase subunit YajC [Gammaproteobacteria bacterium]|jgi:preprotein translocase subunit YajC|nr:preprotein translocase subunit YajC [Gammaproteobacteria bacterium]PHS10215.1 MAG: preprotein translocase subunit YajC [Acidithiobacillus sp.]RTZ62790.1 MAG: preprotein translocase subunit YajC [Gammaproteobacteria bacterium]HAD37532.1 preprotein translocase subunit YajC [Gammaproteobacteria bacterium]HBK77116.1 preprotein translocase subunit YajC [Gammaproteobacteria bacterium]|tara:strand:- start:1076 stop:1402 length:327 start_codon:yes stop_codon:yes gene_type:complete
MSFLISDAWAQVGGDGGSGYLSLLPLVVIFVLFYFLLIRPQQKRSKQHKEMVASVKKGDDVATSGGLLGRVIDLDNNFVTLEIAKGVNVKVQRPSIAQMIPKGSAGGS